METTIALHQDAPPKPQPGESCNGCGLCCAVTLCPLGRLRFWKTKGPCPALAWDQNATRYVCTLAKGRWTRRWIAAGKGCDCTYRVEAPG